MGVYDWKAANIISIGEVCIYVHIIARGFIINNARARFVNLVGPFGCTGNLDLNIIDLTVWHVD